MNYQGMEPTEREYARKFFKKLKQAPGRFYQDPMISEGFELYFDETGQEKDSSELNETPFGAQLRPILKELMKRAFVAGALVTSMLADEELRSYYK